RHSCPEHCDVGWNDYVVRPATDGRQHAHTSDLRSVSWNLLVDGWRLHGRRCQWLAALLGRGRPRVSQHLRATEIHGTDFRGHEHSVLPQPDATDAIGMGQRTDSAIQSSHGGFPVDYLVG